MRTEKDIRKNIKSLEGYLKTAIKWKWWDEASQHTSQIKALKWVLEQD